MAGLQANTQEIEGASGAVLAVVAAFAVYFPDARLFIFPLSLSRSGQSGGASFYRSKYCHDVYPRPLLHRAQRPYWGTLGQGSSWRGLGIRRPLNPLSLVQRREEEWRRWRLLWLFPS